MLIKSHKFSYGIFDLTVTGMMIENGTISALNLPTDKILSNFIESRMQFTKKNYHTRFWS
jgi:hypothetical protein